ncbi:MAG: hypothetical protein Q4G39_01400 [Brachymonas sp.]|nr:hypothetical protein [Brachymonas sp.]
MSLIAVPPSIRKAALAVACASVLGLVACQKTEVTTPPAAPAAPAPTPVPAPTPPTPAPAEAAAPAQDGPVTHFTAYGFSPAWQAEVNGDRLSFDVPETVGVDEPQRVITVTRSAYAKGVNYDGTDGDVAVTLDISSGPCDKATEGNGPREFHATLSYGNSTYRGCADGVR